MNFKAIISSAVFLKIIFTIALFALILIAGISYRHINAVAVTSKLILHTQEVQNELGELLSHLKDAETGQRGYIITGDSSFLEPYNNALNQYDSSFTTLQNLLKRNIQQQVNFDTLKKFIKTRLALLDSNLVYHNKMPVIMLDERMQRGKAVMDKIRSQIKLMNTLEEQYLAERKRMYEKESFLTPIYTLLLVFFSILVFLFSFLKINKDLTHLQKANEILKINSESISQAEEIGDFSNWQWNVETNEYIFSDNLYRLLGCEPQSFEPNLENFLQFIHPEDRHLLIEGTSRVLNEGKTSKHLFRLIRKDGEVIYAKSVSKFLSDVIGKKIIIGITTNVTKDYLHNLSLSEMNKELAESNAELSSFNYVASHDLQEPLRKIQTFISRIKSDDLQNISEIGKGYFERIENAVARMRQLINDLLQFSKINKSDSVFEDTDLNILLDNTTQELGQIIEEKNATIHAVSLPTLHVIPFQIQQVFTNLIVNSLKYSKPGVHPIININCELMDENIIAHEKLQEGKNYYQFIFKDNGLGFSQEYAEQIFVLFKRLHDATTYPGTGIGLAICKKIIDNHSGYICAQSKLGEGSTFIFYLPA